MPVTINGGHMAIENSPSESGKSPSKRLFEKFLVELAKLRENQAKFGAVERIDGRVVVRLDNSQFKPK
jgi:hypothetical protein